MKRSRLTILALAAVPAVAAADTDWIGIRQTGFDLQSAAFQSLKQAAKAGAEPKDSADAAEAMARWGTLLSTLFPPDSRAGHDTKARPEIWTDHPGFEKAASAYTTAAEHVVATTKATDKAAFAQAVDDLGHTCGACHRNYKVKTD